MKLIIILLFLCGYCSTANCNISILANILDKYTPNVFVRWSGIRVKQSWGRILPQEMKIDKNWTELDKNFGKRYSYVVKQDCAFGIDQTTDFKKSCIEILKELKIYKNDKIISQFFKQDKKFLCKQYIKALVNGDVSLKIIQIAKCKDKNNDYKINIILKNNPDDIFYSVRTDCCSNCDSLKLEVIEITKHLPLKTTNNHYQQCLQLCING